MFQDEDIIRVKHPCTPLYLGGELVQVDENDYQIGLRVIEPTFQMLGHVDFLSRSSVIGLFESGAFQIEN